MIPINRHFISLWVYNLVLIFLFVFRMNKVMFLQTTTLLFSEFLKKDRKNVCSVSVQLALANLCGRFHVFGRACYCSMAFQT